ncbi:MAG: hypothetical protein MJ141_00220 [Clostridia bacterium]|nr:hypothetical protein [Clostridia bacterium]
MKKYTFIFCLLICLFGILTGCQSSPAAGENIPHQTEEEVTSAGTTGTVEEAPETEERLIFLNDRFARVVEIGNQMMDCLDGIEQSNAYDKLSQADQYTAEMNGIFDEIVSRCENDASCDRLVYQIRLTQNVSPSKIGSNNAGAIADQVILYQLFMQQMSSLFAYLADEMDYLSGETNRIMEIEYFTEVDGMPTPDTIIRGIQYDSLSTADGVRQYIYRIGDNDSDAQSNYNIYLKALEMDGHFETKIEDDYTFILRDGAVVSISAAGYDTAMGYYLIVSFPG